MQFPPQSNTIETIIFNVEIILENHHCQKKRGIPNVSFLSKRVREVHIHQNFQKFPINLLRKTNHIHIYTSTSKAKVHIILGLKTVTKMIRTQRNAPENAFQLGN